MATNSDGTCPGGAEQCSKHLPGYTVRAAAPFASSSEASRMLLQQYGPLKMRPFHTDPPAKNITAVADIVINGCMPSSGCTAVPQTMSPIECLSVYCADLPSVGVKVTGNYVRVTLLSRLIALAVLLT